MYEPAWLDNDASGLLRQVTTPRSSAGVRRESNLVEPVALCQRAVLTTILVLIVRFFLLGTSMPGIVWVAPIVVAAWWGGFKPGLFATGLITAVALFFMSLQGSLLDGNFNPAP